VRHDRTHPATSSSIGDSAPSDAPLSIDLRSKTNLHGTLEHPLDAFVCRKHLLPPCTSGTVKPQGLHLGAHQVQRLFVCHEAARQQKLRSPRGWRCLLLALV
jgi:hypothetical protein